MLADVSQGHAGRTGSLAPCDRQSLDLAVRFIQDHTITNKALMEYTDTEAWQRRQRNSMEKASEPARAGAFIMECAMIDCVRTFATGCQTSYSWIKVVKWVDSLPVTVF